MTIFQSHRIRFWVGLLLGLLIPASAGAPIAAPHLCLNPGHAGLPAGEQPIESEQQEDESPSGAKGDLVRGRDHAGGRLPVRLLPARRTAVDNSPPAARLLFSRHIPRPSTLHLSSSLAHRGPPAA